MTTPGRPELHRPEPELPTQPPGTPHDALRSRMQEELYARRTVMADRALDTETTSLIAAQLISLDDVDGPEAADRPVTLVVNSPGGPVDAVPAILDTIDTMRCPVDTSCIGQAVGTAAFVVAAGTGRRRAGASAQLRLRLPDIELSGNVANLDAQVTHHRRMVDALVDRLAAITGQDRTFVARDVERGRALTGEEAVSYGLVDEVSARAG